MHQLLADPPHLQAAAWRLQHTQNHIPQAHFRYHLPHKALCFNSSHKLLLRIFKANGCTYHLHVGVSPLDSQAVDLTIRRGSFLLAARQCHLDLLVDLLQQTLP
jgi:hypothetical protein